MKRFSAQKGFTLVELAIVLTIIGLIIGGILKGRQLIQNARVTSTIAQVNAFNAATTAFNDTYGALPGDMANAGTRIPNCGDCTPPAATAGDGAIGQRAWDLRTSQGKTAVTANTSVDNETLYYWAEMAQAGLISGVSYNGAALGANLAAFGVQAPASRLGGGFIVGFANGTTDQPMNPVPSTGPRMKLSGTVLALIPNLATDVLANPATGQQPLDPATAAQIDRKTDDGSPFTGDTQAYGFGSSTAAASGTTPVGCYSPQLNPNDVANSPWIYVEAATAKDCGLFFKING